MVRRFGTFNAMNLFEDDEQAVRYERVADVITELDVDVLAVQEIAAASPQVAQDRLQLLAAMTGMVAAAPVGADEVVAAAAGGHRFAVGLLWRDDPAIVAVPDTLQAYGAHDFFHSLIKVALQVDGVAVTFGSWHGCPIGRRRRADEAERVVSAVAHAGQALLGGDANTIGYAAMDLHDSGREFYDRDPYAGRPWQDGFVHVCTWDDDHGRHLRHQADREAARILAAGGLHDVAAYLDAPWTATAGHHELDALGMPRRLDFIHATGSMLPRLTGYEVADTARARAASDHLPIVATWISGS